MPETKTTWHADGPRVLDAEGNVIAVCRQAKPLNTMQAIRNARKMAAAGELLEALKATLDLVDRYRHGETVSTGLMFSVWEQANNAIAKAESK